MTGPLPAYRDGRRLDRILQAVRASGVEVLRDEASGGRAFWFRRGAGLVYGSRRRVDSPGPVIHLAFGHPTDPFLRLSDRRLLRDVERAFLASGAPPVDPARPDSP